LSQLEKFDLIIPLGDIARDENGLAEKRKEGQVSGEMGRTKEEVELGAHPPAAVISFATFSTPFRSRSPNTILALKDEKKWRGQRASLTRSKGVREREEEPNEPKGGKEKGDLSTDP